VIQGVTCHSAQERMSALLAGGIGARERAQIEAHATRCARCGAVLRDQVALSVALDRAYAPLRARTARLSPARVRLAMRIPEPVPAATRFSRLTARITEFGLAAAVTAFAFAGSASVAPQHAIVDEAVTRDVVTATHVTAESDDQYFFRWLRLNRYAPQADVLDPAVSPKLYDDSPMRPVGHDRAGLLR
jgi:anti-sigma factor RsiW